MFHIPSLSLAQGLLSNPLPLQLNEFFKPSVPLFYNWIHIYFNMGITPRVRCARVARRLYSLVGHPL